MNLLLVRHGATRLNEARRFQGWSDPSLSPEGLERVKRLARTLDLIPTEARIHVSDLRRARETASVLFPDRALHLDPRLRELHFGTFEGLTSHEAQSRHPDQWARWIQDPDGYAPTGGETLVAFRTRIDAWIDEVLDQPADFLVVVAHGGTLGYLCERLGPRILAPSPLPPLPDPGGALNLTLHPVGDE